MPNQGFIKRLPIQQHGDIIIDPQCCTVFQSGSEIHLFPKEFEVLLLLVSYPGWVLSPQQIYESVWREEWMDSARIVSNTICQIRKKLGTPDLIQTVIGFGYKFRG